MLRSLCACVRPAVALCPVSVCYEVPLPPKFRVLIFENGGMIFENGGMIFENAGMIFENAGMIFENAGLIFEDHDLKLQR